MMVDTFNLIGIKQFDRKKENENKVRNRIKSHNNKGKGVISSKMLKDNGLGNLIALSSFRTKQSG